MATTIDDWRAVHDTLLRARKQVEQHRIAAMNDDRALRQLLRTQLLGIRRACGIGICDIARAAAARGEQLDEYLRRYVALEDAATSHLWTDVSDEEFERAWRAFEKCLDVLAKRGTRPA